MALYAAYGANLDPALMGLLAPHSPQRGTGWLVGWRLTFGGEEHGWEGPLATVVEDLAHEVFVALYAVPPHDPTPLDPSKRPALRLSPKLRLRAPTLEA